MQAADTKRIYILLTRHLDNFSKLFRLVTLGQNTYTHASIGMGDSPEYYSFCTNGFRLEKPFKWKNPKRGATPCALLQLTVSQEVYSEIECRIRQFMVEKEHYRYSFLGLMLCLLGFSVKRKNHYFCSQFVSELLTLSGAARLHKPSPLYLPDDFTLEPRLKLCYQGSLCQLTQFA